MTTTRHVPAFLRGIDPQTPRVSRTVQASHDRELAIAADCALLDHPAGRFNLDLIDTTGTYSFSYVRNPGARYLKVEFRVNAAASYGGVYVQCDLTVRDAAGHSVASSDDRIPYGFKNEASHAPYRVLDGPLIGGQTIVTGVVDCDALDDTLTDASWVFEFVFTFTGGAEVNSLQGQEIPRFVVDDAVTHGGVIPGNFQRDAPLDDDATERLGRVLKTLESARAVERTYVSLAWRQQVVVTTETPNVTATSYTEFTALAADAAPQTWRPSPRQVYAGATAGEAIRFRVLYRFSGGAGTETGAVQLTGSATGSPWSSSSLTYTTSWTWSDWITAAIRTSPLSDTLSLKGKVSASGPTLWIASIHVLEAVT